MQRLRERPLLGKISYPSRRVETRKDRTGMRFIQRGQRLAGSRTSLAAEQASKTHHTV